MDIQGEEDYQKEIDFEKELANGENSTVDCDLEAVDCDSETDFEKWRNASEAQSRKVWTSFGIGVRLLPFLYYQEVCKQQILN